MNPETVQNFRILKSCFEEFEKQENLNVVLNQKELSKF